MPQGHTSKLYAVSDAQIAKLTADPAGGTATYASIKDVPGIKSVSIGGDVNTAELRGDNTVLDQNSTLGTVTGSVEHAKLSQDVLDIILGTTTTDSGTTPNMIATTVLAAAPVLNYFKLEAKTPTGGADTVTGDIHFILHKCILTSFPEIGLAEEDYQIVSFEFAAIPLLATGNKNLSIVNNETASAIS